MPYDSIEDLPERTKDLTDKQKRQWMKVFNSVYKQCEEEGEGECETHAAKAAWAAVKKVEEGKFTFLVDSLIITEGVAEGVYKAHGFALHPIITHHPGEPPRVYSAVKEELIKAAPTLKGKHLDIDHSDVPVNPDINIITDSKWNFEVEAVEFWAQIDDYLYELIQSGCPVSVSIDWLIPNQGGIKVVEVNGEIGIAPYGFEFGDPGLSILQQMTPGDPNAMIELLMESISRAQNKGDKKLKERGNTKKKQKIKEQVAQPEPKDDKQRFINHAKIDEETFQLLYAVFGDELFKLLPERGQKVNKQNGEGNGGQNLTVDQIKAKIADLSKKNADIMAQLYPEAELTDEQRATLNAESETIWAEIAAFEKALAAAITAQVGVTLGEGYKVVLEVKLKEAEWTQDFINNLPDSSFAYIEPGGEKDEDGKTKPRSLRHLPFKDAEGNINKAHLNNALGRLAQTDLSDEAKAAAKKKLCAAVKTWNGAHSDDQITSDVCGVEPSGQGSSNKEGLLEAKVTELLARVGKLEKAHGGAQGNLSESLLKNSKEPSIKVTEAIKILEGLLPSPMVERSSMGMQRECQAIRGAVLQLKEMLKNG